MKNILILALIMFSAAFVGCGRQSEANEEVADTTDTTMVDTTEVPSDTVPSDSTITE